MAEKSFWSDKKDIKWFANLWYYYKKVFFISIAVILIIVYGVISCARTVDYDLLMYYFGSTHLNSETFDDAARYFEGVLEDADGKGGVNVLCNNLTSVEAPEAATEIDMVMQSKIHIEIAEGDGYLYIMTKKWLDYCTESDLLEDVSEYIGADEAVYAIEITDNKLMDEFGFSGSEEALYVGVRALNNNRIGKTLHEKKQANAFLALKTIFNSK